MRFGKAKRAMNILGLLLIFIACICAAANAEEQVDYQLPILRATIRKLDESKANQFLSYLQPIMPGQTNTPRLYQQEWDGDTLMSAYYTVEEYKGQAYPNFYFSEGFYGALAKEQEYYSVPSYWLYASCMPGLMKGAYPDRLIDAAFSTFDPIFAQIDIAVEQTPYTINRCPKRTDEALEEQCYSMIYRYVIDNIPCYPFMSYLPSKDTYSINAGVHVLYGERGLLCCQASYAFDIVSKTEPYRLISCDQAEQIVMQRKESLLGIDMPNLLGATLQYVPVPYLGGDMMRDIELVPAWVFGLEHDNGTMEAVLVDAIKGSIIE